MKIESLSQLPNKTERTTPFRDVARKASPTFIDGATIESNDISKESIINVREVANEDGVLKKSTISKFEKNGFIRISGEYSSNYVDFPTTDISNIKVVDGTSFRFILSIKNTIDDANPTLYTSKSFYDELVYTYSQNNPYYVPAATKVPAIVVITLDTLKQKVESLHDSELNRTADNGVLVLKNLFATANFDIKIDPSVKDYKKAVSNPTYNIDDIVRYIDWVVTKPNPNYEQRLLSGKKLGRWKYNTNKNETIDSAFPKGDELPNNLNNPTTFPPFGREGDFQNEVDTDTNGNDWQWDINTKKWVQISTNSASVSSQAPTPPIVAPKITKTLADFEKEEKILFIKRWSGLRRKPMSDPPTDAEIASFLRFFKNDGRKGWQPQAKKKYDEAVANGTL
jgi:hypothetical protein